MGALKGSHDHTCARAVRIAALELLLAIEMSGISAEAAFLASLHKLAENPIREVA
ncbi:hypothetical protein [Burkholderia multivorans]|uniref:hypothetical protein n=1 Tax=Burkholderia multivorans TaxID=87883 RepID=UPI0021C12DCF|nr:hypothetical protein [Burkholderia multivorans]